MTPDFCNGLFEFLGAAFVSAHVVQILKDKQVAGVSILPFLFFLSWGLWNLYFYPAIGCWWSFAGGVALAAMQIWYVSLIGYFYVRNRCLYQ